MLVMLSLADFAACCTDALPVRMCESMVWSTFALSTFVQFFAVGTNQVTFADFASCEPGVPLTRLRSVVVFGRFPVATIAFICGVAVKSAIQSTARSLFPLADGIPRSEPPMNAGIVFPVVWLGIAKAPMYGFSLGLPAFGSSA